MEVAANRKTIFLNKMNMMFPGARSLEASQLAIENDRFCIGQSHAVFYSPYSETHLGYTVVQNGTTKYFIDVTHELMQGLNVTTLHK